MALVWEVNMTSGGANVGNSGFRTGSGSISGSQGSVDDTTADMYSGASVYTISTRYSVAGNPGTVFDFAGNVSGGWDGVLLQNQFLIPYNRFTRTYNSSGNYTSFVYSTTNAVADGYPDGYPRITYEFDKTYNFKFYTTPLPSEGYGFRCYSETGKVVVSSAKQYIKLGASGSVSIANGSSATITQEDANSTDVYIYIQYPSSSTANPFTLSRSSTGFTITNNTGATNTFGYTVFRFA